MSIEKLNNTRSQRGFTLWLTGLSGAGKTTLADRLTQELVARGRAPEVLDGDVVRTNLSKGLGFSKEDRDTNVRRIGFVSGLVTRQGGAVIVAAISPYRDVRDEVRALVSDAGGPGAFVEVYVECPLDELVRRDVKGLYAKALRGEIANFTGVSDPYEPPLSPEIVVRTDRETVDASAARILAYLEAHGLLAAAAPPASTTNATVRAPATTSTAASVPPLFAALGRPHGGRLVDRRVSQEEASVWRERIRRGELPALEIGAREVCDLELLGNGAFSPLEGFMGATDYHGVVRSLRLASGLVWSIPVVLGTSEAQAAQLTEGQDVVLLDGRDGRFGHHGRDSQGGQEGAPLAILHLREKFLLSGDEIRIEAREVYRTDEEAHPGVSALYARGPVLLGGQVTVLQPPSRPTVFKPYRLDPADTRAAFAARGWRSVVAFQTRNPVHRAHEYLLKTALEGVDGLLLHPLVGETKEDDIPADVRLRCYEALLDSYFPRDRVLLSVLPAAMRYAGPREALFHALMRKNHGCTHFIVGRDHAGVGNYYGTYDAQRIFHQFTEEELGIRPLFFEHSFFCAACGALASAKSCPHGLDQHVTLSGTRVRQLLAEGAPLPTEFTRPEVAAILSEAARVARETVAV